METLTFEVKELATKEVTLKLPFYCKGWDKSQTLYKIVDPKRALQVQTINSINKYSLTQVSPDLALHGGYIEITAEEFDKAYELVNDELNKLAL